MARKGSLKRKLRTLSEREAQQRRDLGAAVLEMYRADRLDQAVLENGAQKLKETTTEIAETEEALGLRDEPSNEESGKATEPSTQEAGTSEPQTEVAPIPSSTGPGGAKELEPTPAPSDQGAAAEETSEQPAAGPPSAEQSRDEPPEGVPEPEKEPEPEPAATPPRAAEADERSTAAMIALEQDLERAQHRAGQALDALREQLEQAQARADGAEERSRLQQSENRTAAAEWLRGQAEAMRREAERQVREELAASTSPAPTTKEETTVTPIENTGTLKPSAAAETALAQMTQRSNEANARAQEAERRLTSAVSEAEERGRREAEKRLAKELRAREEELQQERQAKARALEAAEKRLSEIEAHVAEAERRAAEAESTEPAAAGAPAGGGRTSLNLATFDQLRELGLSPTQANRVIAYRERLGGYKAIDDLRQVPGMPDALVADLRARLEL